MNDQFPVLNPDAARRDRTRARCHKTLVQQRRRRVRRRRAVERTIVISLGVLYLSSLAFDVVRVLIR